jgi:hypothetical protein
MLRSGLGGYFQMRRLPAGLTVALDTDENGPTVGGVSSVRTVSERLPLVVTVTRTRPALPNFRPTVFIRVLCAWHSSAAACRYFAVPRLLWHGGVLQMNNAS